MSRSSTRPHLIAYREIAGRRRTVPVELAVGMLRPADDVLMVHTEASTEYVTAAGLEELRKHHTIQSQKVLIRKGEPWSVLRRGAAPLGFVKRLAVQPARGGPGPGVAGRGGRRTIRRRAASGGRSASI